MDVSCGDTEPFSASAIQQIQKVVPPGLKQLDPRLESSVVDLDRQGITDILRIIPSNDKAKRAFDELAERKLNNKLDSHHSQYIITTGKDSLETNIPYQSRPDDETTSDDSGEALQAVKEIRQGYFRINFDCSTIRPHIEFVLGRGSGKKYGPNRNVDILLAAPDTGRTKYTRGLKAAHAFVKIHPISGAWMLYAAEGPIPLSIPQRGTPNALADTSSSLESLPTTTAILNDEVLHARQYRALSRCHNTLRINDMQYHVDFLITKPDQEPIYLQKRDEALKAAGAQVPETIISAIPFEIDGSTRSAVFRSGLGSGSFGRVFEGFDRITGDLRVVKRIQLSGAHERPLVEKEIKANRLFSGSEGIVTLYECSNSEGGEGTQARTYPFDVFLVQERGVAFNKYLWQAENPVPWTLRSTLLRQLLNGLVTIHQQKCIHRDITPMNILYFNQEPKHAAFCDFGKICYSESDTDCALAAWMWLPPEVKETKNAAERSTYNQKLDIWMLGIAVLHCWYPEILRGLRTDFKRRYSDHETTICDRLRAESLSGLSRLLLRMISWRAGDRPSAEQALNDPCLMNAAPKQPEPAKSSDRKRSQAGSSFTCVHSQSTHSRPIS